MIAKIFALLGFAWARRWANQSELDQTLDWLRYLEGAKTALLEERDYAWIEKRFPAALLAEYREKTQRLRNHYTRAALEEISKGLREKLKLDAPKPQNLAKVNDEKSNDDEVDYITDHNVG